MFACLGSDCCLPSGPEAVTGLNEQSAAWLEYGSIKSRSVGPPMLKGNALAAPIVIGPAHTTLVLAADGRYTLTCLPMVTGEPIRFTTP